MMARYEVTFVIETDLEEVGSQPWWPIIGEEPMPVEWLEYIMVRDLSEDEYVLDVEFEENTINIVDMTFDALTQEPQKVKLELVVDNGEKNEQ
jgi:hypothetical protein